MYSAWISLCELSAYSPGLTITYPFFGFIGIHIQFFSQHWNRNTLMNSTKRFKNHQSRIFNEIIQTWHQKEVGFQDFFALSQFLLSSIKVEVNVEILDEWRNRIFVSVRLFLNYFDKVEHDVASGILINDNSCGQIPEKKKQQCIWFRSYGPGYIMKQDKRTTEEILKLISISDVKKYINVL